MLVSSLTSIIVGTLKSNFISTRQYISYHHTVNSELLGEWATR